MCWTTAVNPEMMGVYSHAAQLSITSSSGGLTFVIYRRITFTIYQYIVGKAGLLFVSTFTCSVCR